MPKTTKGLMYVIPIGKDIRNGIQSLISKEEFIACIHWDKWNNQLMIEDLGKGFSQSEVDKQLDVLRDLMSEQHYEKLDQLRKELHDEVDKSTTGFINCSWFHMRINDLFSAHGLEGVGGVSINR